VTRPGNVQPGRREVLTRAAGIVLAVPLGLPLAGCLPDAADDEPDRPDPDLLLRARVADEVRALAAQYAAVIARFPAAADELATLAAEHEEHARALLPRRVAHPLAPTSSSPVRSPSSAPAGSSSSSATATATPPVAATLRTARADLASAEAAAARRRTRQTLRAEPVTARLLASIAGCEAAHAALLVSRR